MPSYEEELSKNLAHFQVYLSDGIVHQVTEYLGIDRPIKAIAELYKNSGDSDFSRKVVLEMAKIILGFESKEDYSSAVLISNAISRYEKPIKIKSKEPLSTAVYNIVYSVENRIEFLARMSEKPQIIDGEQERISSCIEVLQKRYDDTNQADKKDVIAEAIARAVIKFEERSENGEEKGNKSEIYMCNHSALIMDVLKEGELYDAVRTKLDTRVRVMSVESAETVFPEEQKGCVIC